MKGRMLRKQYKKSLVHALRLIIDFRTGPCLFFFFFKTSWAIHLTGVPLMLGTFDSEWEGADTF